ncbi:MAG: hypothetical protein ACI91O_000539 [Candidatus Poriferisodalaceae bacterium]|jgi:hypothetical protein
MALYDTDLPVRSDITAAHETMLDRWANPGTWWTGAERLAIVAEVRRARDAAETPPPWVRASTVDGLIPDGGILPAAAVDAVWRLTNHPGTLTAEWYESIVGDEVSAAQYTELVGVVAQANCIDRFVDALDIGRATLPDAVAGKPTGEVPDDIDVRKHWVPTAQIQGPNVLKALSAVPEENVSRGILSQAHYLPEGALMGDLVSDHNSLTRLQIELLAARTSKLNECFY